MAIPTHRAIGKPFKNLGLFQNCFLELPDPSAPRAAKTAKTAPGKPAPKKKPQKKKPKMGIQITMNVPKTGTTGADKVASASERPSTVQNRSVPEVGEATELRTVALGATPHGAAVTGTDRASPDEMPQTASAGGEKCGGSGNRVSGDLPSPNVPTEAGIGSTNAVGVAVGGAAVGQLSGALKKAGGGDAIGKAGGNSAFEQPSGALKTNGGSDQSGGTVGGLVTGQPSGTVKFDGCGDAPGGVIWGSLIGKPSGALKMNGNSGAFGQLVRGTAKGRPSGALKRKRSEEPAPEPHPAAFFRTQDGYAVVNKPVPDLAGAEGDWRTIGCSCCLQRKRAAETTDLLPAVTVYQAIGHLPKLATAEKMVSANSDWTAGLFLDRPTGRMTVSLHRLLLCRRPYTIDS